MSIRSDLADAIASAVSSTRMHVSAAAVGRPTPPHVMVEPDQPYMDPFTFGNAADVWAFKATIVIPLSGRRRDQGLDWFETAAPLIDQACRTQAGARLHLMDAPQELELGGKRYWAAVCHITIKRARS